ncbi:hypothetical protein GSI_15327 [Ganoderma sinense ZZ0214-1]|uniref:DUF6534 domain-containing protein n=1 Tax=Ganoderma sinense ZZ0214-1 TaxID=1077348 RepID=A0A2G8RM96_9APHY|nr:hypothetical protein GSI_15327 [Ganoderma sinense ZZ0214-1]
MPLNINKNTTFGAAFAGFAASCVCLGIQSMQTYSYFKRFPLDKPLYKLLVFGLLLIEYTDQALIAHAVYTYLVSNWGSLPVLAKPPLWSLILQITLGVATGTIVKLCFVSRVWRFSKRNIFVTAFIVLLTLGEVGMATLYTIRGFRLKSLQDLGTMKPVGMLSLGIGVATDVVIAFSLCFFLRNLRTGHRQDDSMVNSLILYALSTGAVTAAISLTTLILYNFMPDNFIFMACYFVLSKMYAISFLAALNTRRVSRGRGTDAQDTATVPTFLMVGKFTQRTIQIDPEYAASPVSPGSRTMDGKSPLSPSTPGYSTPGNVHYAEAW